MSCSDTVTDGALGLFVSPSNLLVATQTAVTALCQMNSRFAEPLEKRAGFITLCPPDR